MCRGDHANIGVGFASAADPTIMAVFEHPQQLRLQGRHHLADFVHEQSTALGHFHQPRLGLTARERALLVAEQFALQKSLL